MKIQNIIITILKKPSIEVKATQFFKLKYNLKKVAPHLVQDNKKGEFLNMIKLRIEHINY